MKNLMSSEVNFDHKIRTRNENERNALRMIEIGSEFLAEYLNVKVSVRAERMNGWGSSDARYAGRCFFLGKNNTKHSQIKINFRNLSHASMARILEVLCHEFRHAKQWQDEEVGNAVNFKSMPYINHGPVYENHPMEIDAREYQKVYAQLVIEECDLSFIDFDDVLEGELDMVWDQTGQRLELGHTEEDPIAFIKNRKTPNVVKYIKLSQLNNKRYKKWTNRAFNEAFENCAELLNIQKVEKKMAPAKPYEIGY